DAAGNQVGYKDITYPSFPVPCTEPFGTGCILPDQVRCAINKKQVKAYKSSYIDELNQAVPDGFIISPQTGKGDHHQRIQDQNPDKIINKQLIIRIIGTILLNPGGNRSREKPGKQQEDQRQKKDGNETIAIYLGFAVFVFV